MRTVKFRGQFRVDKTWRYGFYWFNQRKQHFIAYQESNDDGDFMVDAAVLPETVGEYSGLDDMNNVEIYEGDIIESKYEVCYKVEFVDGCYWGIALERYEKDVQLIDLCYMSAVVGNIYGKA